MPIPKHLDDAAERLARAEARILQMGEPPVTVDGLRDWVRALTEYVFALSEVQRYSNESVHEKLHELAGQVHARPFSQPNHAPH